MLKCGLFLHVAGGSCGAVITSQPPSYQILQMQSPTLVFIMRYSQLKNPRPEKSHLTFFYIIKATCVLGMGGGWKL